MEKYKKGGYTILDLESSTIYADSVKALESNKPVVVYDGTNAPYFADSISLSGTNVVITKGGKTITIANDNTITNVGDILTIMENIVDSKGNNRFIEGDGIVHEFSGVTYSYAKWSLSGTHLMLVLSASIANGTEIPATSLYMDCVIPKWIYDKIVPVFGTNIELKNATLYAEDYSTQNLGFRFTTISDNTVRIQNSNSVAFTLTADRTFRLQFDLLIDNE